MSGRMLGSTTASWRTCFVAARPAMSAHRTSGVATRTSERTAARQCAYSAPRPARRGAKGALGTRTQVGMAAVSMRARTYARSYKGRAWSWMSCYSGRNHTSDSAHHILKCTAWRMGARLSQDAVRGE